MQAQRLSDGSLTIATHTTCPAPRPSYMGKDDQHPLPDGGVGLTLSGGGFRATFAALGVVRYLADVGMLEQLALSSSVSGGSVANGIVATRWPELRDRGYSAAAVDELLIDPTVSKIASKSLKTYLLQNVWRSFGSKNRTDVLAWAFDKWFMDNTKLHQLDDDVRWVINAANMATGTRFTLEGTIVGDYVNGYVSANDADLKVALAAAASAAVPGAFAPLSLNDLELPCRGEDTVSLLDGGAYDNTGIEVLSGDKYAKLFTICLAAGGLFKIGGHGKFPIVRDLARAHGVLYRQSRGLRTRDIVHQILDPKSQRQGLVFKLDTSEKDVTDQIVGDPAAVARVKAFVSRFPAVDDGEEKGKTIKLADVSTSFDQFPEPLSRRLVRRGWWTAGLTMTAFYPDHAAALGDDVEAPPI